MSFVERASWESPQSIAPLPLLGCRMGQMSSPVLCHPCPLCAAPEGHQHPGLGCPLCPPSSSEQPLPTLSVLSPGCRPPGGCGVPGQPFPSTVSPAVPSSSPSHVPCPNPAFRPCPEQPDTPAPAFPLLHTHLGSEKG